MADSEWCGAVNNAMVVKNVKRERPVKIVFNMQKDFAATKTHFHSHYVMPFKTSERNSSKIKTF